MKALMRIYIAGPMTGLPEFNYPAFAEAAAALAAEGHEPINPAVSSEAPTVEAALPWDWYVRRALRLLLDAQGIALLPGWEGSRGARIEQRLAADLGMPALPLTEWLHA